jgi:hypothetical protein
MAIKIGKVAVHAIIITLLLAILYFLIQGKGSSFTPSPLVSMPGPNASGLPASIFDLPQSIECVAGPGPSADYYALSGAGVCGGSEFVLNSMHDYSIEEGIGGPLLSK